MYLHAERHPGHSQATKINLFAITVKVVFKLMLPSILIAKSTIMDI